MSWRMQPVDVMAAHHNAMDDIHWMSNGTATVAIVVVIDLYKTDPYGKSGRMERTLAEQYDMF